HLGAWTDGELARAIVFGQSRDGSGLFPYMPYFEYRDALAREDSASATGTGTARGLGEHRCAHHAGPRCARTSARTPDRSPRLGRHRLRRRRLRQRGDQRANHDGRIGLDDADTAAQAHAAPS
ncbi:MAG: hypothetical protein ACOZQL_02430, partial [Myxococcota bacterium]